MHIRPMYLLYLPFALLIIILEQENWKQKVRYCLLLTLGTSIAVLPWSLYLSKREGGFILLSTNGGETIAGGLNPQLIENGYKKILSPRGRISWTGPGKWMDNPGYLNDQEKKLPPVNRDALLKRRAIAWTISHPRDALLLQTAKLAYMWTGYPFYEGIDKILLGTLPSLAMLSMAMASLFVLKNHRKEFFRYWSLPLFVSCVAMVSWGSWRFRQPGDVGMLVMAMLFGVKNYHARSRST